jgi:tRNA (adenine22-N1)-methyltransferase
LVYIKLNDHLQAAADLVLKDQTCADIGTDHNYLPTYLVQNRICSKVIASDKADQPYHNATKLVKNLALANQIDMRQGWGLQVLKPFEAQTIVMTGMGANLIQDILENGLQVLETTKRLVLQPQRNADIVRRWLAANNWQIVEERIVFENEIYYVIIAAEPGQRTLTIDEVDFGPYNLQYPTSIFKAYLESEQIKISDLLVELENHQSNLATKRTRQLQNRSKRIKEILTTMS